MVPKRNNLSSKEVKELNWRCGTCGENHLSVDCTTLPVMGSGYHYMPLNALAQKIMRNRRDARAAKEGTKPLPPSAHDRAMAATAAEGHGEPEVAEGEFQTAYHVLEGPAARRDPHCPSTQRPPHSIGPVAPRDPKTRIRDLHLGLARTHPLVDLFPDKFPHESQDNAPAAPSDAITAGPQCEEPMDTPPAAPPDSITTDPPCEESQDIAPVAPPGAIDADSHGG
jgi:hypothetical protein